MPGTEIWFVLKSVSKDKKWNDRQVKEVPGTMIVDMHCDTLSELREKRRSGSREGLRQNTLCLDLERMKENHYLLQNFAVFVELKQTKDPFEDAMDQIRLFKEEMENNCDICSQVYTYEDIRNNIEKGKLSALLSLEEGGICGGDIASLKTLYEAGARMMTLCWNYENELGYPATPEEDGCAEDSNLQGLKKRGIEFLGEMEELGMIPDVSHLSDQGFWDVVKYTEKPFVASHSNARAVWNHGRNLTGPMLRALGERGCVAGLNYYPLFLNGGDDSEKASSALARHALSMVDQAGIESVGLGSDFDGFPASSDVSDPSGMDNLVWALHRAGFSDRETDLICGGNVLRLYREVLKQ